MKAILLSDRPKWCALMMNDIKKIEVRKGTALYKAIQKLIDEYGYAEFYVYCTKGKPFLFEENVSDDRFIDTKPYQTSIQPNKYLLEYDEYFNGKVIFKFRCHKVEDILFDITCITNDLDKLYTITNDENKLLEISCLTKKQISSYLKLDGCFPHLSSSNKGFFSSGFAIHISCLEIFDKPKELSEFYKVGHYKDLDDYFTDEKQINGKWCIPLKKAPQSFTYIEVGE